MAVREKRGSSGSAGGKKTKKKSPAKAATGTRAKNPPKPTALDNHRRVQAELVDDEPLNPIEASETNPIESFIPDESEIGTDPIAVELERAEAGDRLPVHVPFKADDEKALTTADPVTAYLAEIRKYKLLTKEQEYDLAVRYRESGDAKAAELLVTSNLRFVVKIATEYSKFGAKLIDLIQEGNVGLMHAVREFNPYKGVRLITYAVWWIRGYIQEYLMRQYSMVRIGTTQNQRKLFYRLQKEKERLDSMGQEPTIPLLSSRLGVSEEEIQQMSQRMSGRDISLNQPIDPDSNASLLDLEASHEPMVDEQLGEAEHLEVLRQNIEKIRPQLNEKELYILENRVLADEPMTLQEIGEHYGVTREAVRQLEARLINRIRTSFNESVATDREDISESQNEDGREDGF